MGRVSRDEPSSKLPIVIAAALVLLVPSLAWAHPSPVDFPGISRHDLGVGLSLFAAFASIAAYVMLGLRRSSRAATVAEYFYYDKQARPGQYFDAMVGYSFQVAVTIYFVFWGFKYGIWIVVYAAQWLLGIYLFQRCATRLRPFALSNHTLHSFIAERYGTSLTIRRLTACCTIVGLLGALLIEASYGADILGSYLTVSPVPVGEWSVIYIGILFLTWVYVQYGGFKATTITAGLQLPLAYGALAIVLDYLVFLAFRSGYQDHARLIGILLTLSWLAVVAARASNLRAATYRDLPSLVAGLAALSSAMTLAVGWVVTQGIPPQLERVVDIPDSFTWAAFAAQDRIVFVGFLILNVSWQFFDMAAWQRVGALDLRHLGETEQVRAISRTIGETKWESPVTWILGIIMGIALRHSGLFGSGAEATDAFATFVRTLSDNDLPPAVGMAGTYVALPALVAAFAAIMFSTTDGLLSAITFAWVYDLSGYTPEEFLSETTSKSQVIRRSRVVALVLMLCGGGLLVLINKILGMDIFVLLSTIYSAQFVITYFTIGALYVRNTAAHKKYAIGAVVSALLANAAAATYCFLQMRALPESQWSDWFYVLPTIASAVVGTLVFLVGLLLP